MTVLLIQGLFLSPALSQSVPQSRSNVDSIISYLQSDGHLNARDKSDLADSAFAVAGVLHDTCQQVYLRVIQSSVLDDMGMSDSALAVLYWANSHIHDDCDSIWRMRLLSNLTSVFLSLGEYERIDSVSRIAMELWNHNWTDKGPRFAILNNLAITKFVDDTPGSVRLFNQVLREAEEDRNYAYVQKALSNLGTVKAIGGDLDSAYYYFTAAAGYAERNEDVENQIDLMINLANLDGERGHFRRAATYLDSAFHIAELRDKKGSMASVQIARAALFAQMNNFRDAYTTLQDYTRRREEYLDEERVKAVTEMMEKFESEKKARQIQDLELQKLDADLRNTKITAARNRFLYGGIFVLLVSAGLWSRLRYVRKSRAAVQKEKDISEGLLLNILPASVAGELKAKGHAEARLYENATVLFSDFRGFTSVSERLKPSELVDELNVCFKAFDAITTNHGIEKIKTIGDSYMCAGGLPDTNTATAADMVHAGLEMQTFVTKRKQERESQGLPSFEMRIGIHSGPVVAGVVGERKFQYDIWGDAVNIASRMESSGEVGRVNISADTYSLVKDNPALRFTARGRIQAKGKGEMEMYFADFT